MAWCHHFCSSDRKAWSLSCRWQQGLVGIWGRSLVRELNLCQHWFRWWLGAIMFAALVEKPGLAAAADKGLVSTWEGRNMRELVNIGSGNGLVLSCLQALMEKPGLSAADRGWWSNEGERTWNNCVKTILVQVMALCATSHYLSHWWPRSMFNTVCDTLIFLTK